jgi:hypothetical protein
VDVYQFGSRFHIHGGDDFDSNTARLNEAFTVRGLGDLREIHVGTVANIATAQYFETNQLVKKQVIGLYLSRLPCCVYIVHKKTEAGI